MRPRPTVNSLRSLDQLDKVTAVTYDAGGNQLTVRDPNNVGADMVYDALGRNTQRTDTFGAITKTDYDRSGNAVKQTDAKNKFTLISFDSRNRRKSTTDRITAATNFVYTALGQLQSLTDAENQTTAYTYDARGSKLTEQYPDHVANSTVGQPGYGIVTFVYDKAGRVSRKQDQAGDTCSYNYDLAGRMTSRNYRTAANSPSGTIADTDTFTFDRAGRMLTAVNGRYTNTVTYAFDPAGRKASEGLTISGRTYTIGSSYNARNELVKYTYPDGSVADRAYTARGALSQLKLDTATVDTRTYDDGGRMLTSTLGNGITETRAYRTDNLLTSINSSNTNLGNLAYTWDVNKNKTAETITGVMSNYGFTAAGTTYDFEDRLTGFRRAAASGPALLSQSWSLSTVGDWNSVTTNGTAQTRTHGPTHELLTAGGQSVTTDVKGNTTLLPAVLSSSSLPSTASSLTYDFDNKLRSVDLGNNASVDVNYQYDALGRRVARTGTGGSVVYVQADQQTIADYPLGGAPATPTYRYVYASYIDEPVVRKGAGTSGTVHYYHRNQQYSIYAITDAAANIAERYAYTAYGQPTILNAAATVITTSAISNRYTYTAREWDATVGLHHFRARWMSGLTGRFLSRDSIEYVDGYNLYGSYLAQSYLDDEGTQVFVPPSGPGVGPVINPPPGIFSDPVVLQRPLAPTSPTEVPFRPLTPRVLPVAGGCAVADGPIIPLGEAIGGTLLICSIVYDACGRLKARTALRPVPYYPPLGPPKPPKRYCSSQYPGWVSCDRYPYTNKSQILREVFGPEAKAEGGGGRRGGNANSCGAGGGEHFNVRVKGLGFLGSILCCNCCEDTPSGPVTKTGCKQQ